MYLHRCIRVANGSALLVASRGCARRDMEVNGSGNGEKPEGRINGGKTTVAFDEDSARSSVALDQLPYADDAESTLLLADVLAPLTRSLLLFHEHISSDQVISDA